MRKAIKPIFIFVLVFSLFAPPQSVRADMAPPPAPSLGGLRPLEYQPTEVEMIYERVELNLQPAAELNYANSVNEVVNVTAWFVLRNTGKVDERMQATFPLDSLSFCDLSQDSLRSWGIQQLLVDQDSFKVESNGIPLETHVIQIEGIDCVNWAAFDMYFPVNKDVLVKVDYSMETSGVGHDLMLEYVLETGAGWKGSIKQAYIIFRFPYLVSPGNVDASITTPGYQSLYNEIFWSFQNIEPTPNDNIVVAFFEPYTWAVIQEMEDWLEKNPRDIETWLKLFNEYAIGAPYYSTETISALFEKAIKNNPDNAELYALYAEFLVPSCCYYLQRGDTNLPPGAREFADRRVFPLLTHAFELEPANERAHDVLEGLEYVFPDLTFTPPPTIPPTATSQFTLTPSVTPSATITPIPSETPVVVTVVHTKVVNATPKPERPTVISSPTEVVHQEEEKGEASALPMFFGALLLFIAGIGTGIFWQRRTK